MSVFIELRALAGTNYVRAGDVIAVQYAEPQKCIVMLAGGASLSCNEPAVAVKTRVDAAVSSQNEVLHGNASR